MSKEALDNHKHLPQTLTDNPTGHQDNQGQQTQPTNHSRDEPSNEEKKARKSLLHTVPLGAASLEVKLAKMRQAIAAGADVNGLDYSLPKGHREGRPLHACLRRTHMAGNATFSSNDQVVQFLLDHGADPRLCAGNAGIFWSPLHTAISEAEAKDQTEWGKGFYGRIVAMMKEAVVKLEAKEKAGAD